MTIADTEDTTVEITLTVVADNVDRYEAAPDRYPRYVFAEDDEPAKTVQLTIYIPEFVNQGVCTVTVYQ